MSLRDLLRKHDYFYGILRYARKSRDIEYREKVKHIDDDDRYHLDLFVRGGQNPDVLIYAIEYWNPLSGFFATHLYMLLALEFADICHMTPVIKYPDDWIYGDKESNGFEIFYRQPCGISWQEAMQSRTVVAYNYKNTWTDRDIYNFDEEALERLAHVSKKYLHFREGLEVQIQKEIDSLLQSKKTLAVHFRGSDYKKNFSEHPKFISEEDYISKVKEMLKKGTYEQIFLATDDMDAKMNFEKAFGECLVTYEDVIRSANDCSPIFNQVSNDNNTRVAYEVIRDMKTMAACDGLVGGKSCVTTCAQIEKKLREEHYAEVVIMDQGVNAKSSNTVSSFEKSMQKQRIRGIKGDRN